MLLLLLFLLYFLVCGAAFAYAILQPFARAVGGRARPNRFITSDLLWLMTMLALPMGCLSAVVRGYDAVPVAVVSGLLIAVFAFAWWRGTATLSGLGIRQPLRRWIFLVVILPVSFVGGALTPLVLLASALAIGEMHRRPHISWISLASAAGLLLLAVSFRRLSYWVLKGME
jgi:hypothetical protein